MLKRDKRQNISKILHALWIHKTASRIQIARFVDLDKSTVTLIVNELIESGHIVVVAEGKAGPQGGRRPVMLTINEKYGVVVGLEIQSDFCKLSAVDLAGDLISTSELAITTPSSIYKLIDSVVCDFASSLEEQGHRVLGLGVGLPGVVDPYSSILYKSIPLEIDEPLYLTESDMKWNFGPIIYENDAKCCAWGELGVWREERIKDFLTVLIEYNNNDSHDGSGSTLAVGFSIVINGQVHHGKNFSAGEFRSLQWHNSSDTQFSFSKEELTQLLKGDECENQFTVELSQHIAFLVNMFNLTHIFLGGKLEKFKKSLLLTLKDEMNRNWPYNDTVECDISFVTQKDNAVSYGAASLILNAIFSEDNLCSHEGVSLPSGVDFLLT